MRALNNDADLRGFDVALFSAGGGTSSEWAPRFVDAGAVVVDNSSAWRRDPDIPLVVSDVNPHALKHHRGLIANPNCSTMQLLVALAPIHGPSRDRAPDRVHVPVGLGHGQEGDRRTERPGSRLAGQHRDAPRRSVCPDPIAFNVIGAAGNFADGDDHTDEARR